MKISNCPYIHYETIIGTKCEGNCNLYPNEWIGRSFQFVPCESIPISKCKFKTEAALNALLGDK